MPVLSATTSRWPCESFNRMTCQDENTTPSASTSPASEQQEPTPEKLSHNDELAQLQSELRLVRRELIAKSGDLEKWKIERLQELGVVVHGLRNSANSVLSATEYLIEDAANVLTEEQMALLRGATQSSLSILEMLENVADFSRFEAELAMNFAPTDGVLRS